ncbi:hypothetical protein [Desulfobacterium sp. N47]|uniref:Uncharacterized protein n=1 Tax=uncultured Desulfobacterium sp. TaxID=201089 RepID=E1YDY2_9BACT|nr:unknown protein [uncultured Desulfobacterium sp.]
MSNDDSGKGLNSGVMTGEATTQDAKTGFAVVTLASGHLGGNFSRGRHRIRGRR